MNTYTFKSLTLSLAVLALSACGGGGSSGGGDVVADNGGNTGGIEGTGVRVFASIDGFGSVIVEGIEFDTSNASIEIDDEPGTEDNLQSGDVVIVYGEIDAEGNASASVIISDDVVRGPVEQIDLANDTFIVLGQVVRVSVDTAFDDDIPLNGIEGLVEGQSVRVSGYRDADGVIRATRIDDSDSNELQIIGEVINANDTAMTFQIGTLFTAGAFTVNYAGATLDEDFGGNPPADGDLVEAEGMMLNAAGELVALEVELLNDDFVANEDDRVEIEGIVTDVLSGTVFVVNGIEITRDGNTRYEDGTADDLLLNAEVDVEAVAQADGSLLAVEIEFEQEKEIRIDAFVDSVDAAAGTLSVLGITVSVDEGTRYEDDSDLDIRRFSLEDISIGDFVEIGGAESTTVANEVVAALIKRDDDGALDEISLRARVQSVNEPAFTMLGVTVETSQATEFEADDEQPLTPAEFFANAQDRIVEAEGTWDGTVLNAQEVEFED
jgi:hypothetical protein